MTSALGEADLDDVDASAIVSWIAPVPEAPGLPRNDAIRIATEFVAAPSVSGWPDDAEAVWLGTRVTLRATGSTRSYAFARVDGRGPAPRGFIAPLRSTSFAEETDLEQVVAALRAERAVGASPAVAYVRAAEPVHGYRPIVAARGLSAVIDGGPDARAFVRQAGARLLVLEPRSTATASGAPYAPAGAYSELWRLS
ncbi:MAG: hypothetical protein IPL61_20020 [Myxococcales bacterium]|nr:hypothetical protein [Myxococcales bacterium]